MGTIVALAPVALFAPPPRAGDTALAASGLTDVAAAAGVNEMTRTYSVDATDSDALATPGSIAPSATAQPWAAPSDDALVVRHNPQAFPSIPRPQLFVSTGAAYEQRFSSWSQSDRHDCAWGDYDRDGYLDLFCAIGLDPSSVNELWHNDQDGTYSDVTAAQGLNDTGATHGKYRTATFVDANKDGWPDIYVTRFNGSEAGMFPSPADAYPNELWINDASNTGFHLAGASGLSVKASAQKDNDGCNTAYDFDGNGSQDVIMCGSSAFRLYKSSGGAFSNVAGAAGLTGFWADAEWGDFNGDGLADLAQVKAGSVRVMEQTAAHSFRLVWSAPVTGGLNLAVGNADGAGALDIYTVGTCTGSPLVDQPDYLFSGSSANIGAPTGASLQFSMQQLPSLGKAAAGCGNSVDAVDYDRDGRADFFVLNGRMTHPGPTQLFSYQP